MPDLLPYKQMFACTDIPICDTLSTVRYIRHTFVYCCPWGANGGSVWYSGCSYQRKETNLE